MPKVEIVLGLILAACAGDPDKRVNKLYADMANLQNQYYWICQNQPDNGDVMANDAVAWAKGDGAKPAWLTQGGL